MFDLALGSVLAVLTIWLFRQVPPPRERMLWALALAVAALIYVGFSLAGGGGARWTAIEVGGLVLYGGTAWLGWKVSPWFLAGGWLAHVGWDVALHGGEATAFVPAWYPVACVAYDLSAGLYLAWRSRSWAPRRDAARAVAGEKKTAPR